jgi:hypothetical protein
MTTPKASLPTRCPLDMQPKCAPSRAVVADRLRSAILKGRLAHRIAETALAE